MNCLSELNNWGLTIVCLNAKVVKTQGVMGKLIK